MKFFLLCLMSCCSTIYAMGNSPTYSNEFLEIPRGARAFAFADASIAMPDDAFSVGGNPALLQYTSFTHNAALMHVNHFEGLASSNLAAYTTRLDSLSVLGVSVLRFGVDQIPNTIDLIDPSGNFDYDRLRFFSTADYAFHLAYARKWTSRSSWGVNLKLIYRKVGSFANAYGLGWDVGYYAHNSYFSYAFQLTDVSTTFTSWSYNADELQIPDFVLPSGDTIRNAVPNADVELKLPVLRAAISYPIRLSPQFQLTTMAALKLSSDGQRNTLFQVGRFSVDPSFATELGYESMVFLRLGCSQFQKISKLSAGTYWSVEPSLGLGLKFANFQIDYALGNVSSMGLARFSHIFSLKYAWGN